MSTSSLLYSIIWFEQREWIEFEKKRNVWIRDLRDLLFDWDDWKRRKEW
jgi:hypothetical protein